MPNESSSAADVAAILADYVPKAEYEQTLELLEQTLAERDTHKTAAEKSASRITELEGKVRGRAAKDVFNQIADKLKIDPKFKDDVFDLAKFKVEGDEPDAKAIEKQLSEFLSEKKHFILDEKAKPLTKPEGGGRGTPATPDKTTMTATKAQMRDALWMRDNQKAVSMAAAAGALEITD
jgi:hypothetical protein